MHFGILYYPFELLIDFLNRVGQINETTTAIISIPQFDINFMGYQATLFQGYTFDFNTILSNETYKNIHTIYLTVVDIILWLSVVYLAAKCIQNIIGGIANSTVDAYNETESENNSKRRR